MLCNQYSLAGNSRSLFAQDWFVLRNIAFPSPLGRPPEATLAFCGRIALRRTPNGDRTRTRLEMLLLRTPLCVHYVTLAHNVPSVCLPVVAALCREENELRTLRSAVCCVRINCRTHTRPMRESSACFHWPLSHATVAEKRGYITQHERM